MIYLGNRSVKLKSEKILNQLCSNCNSANSLEFNVYGKYFHIWFVPMIPTHKTGFKECTKCNNAIEFNNTKQNSKSRYYSLVNKTSYPYWFYAGGVVTVLGIIAMVYYWNVYEKKYELEYLSKPKVGDIYEYNTKINYYSTLKVLEVTADSVFVSQNTYEISDNTKISDIDIVENYPKTGNGISRKKVVKMYNEDIIYDVNRED